MGQFLFQFIGNGFNRDDFLFITADNIVIKGSAVVNAACGSFQVRRFVHNHRRISGPGSDEPFIGNIPGGFHHRFAAGHHQKVDARKCEKLLGCLDGGLFDAGEQVADARFLVNGLVQHLDGFLGDAFGRRMRAENHSVAAADHTDGIVDNGSRRIGGWGYGGDNTPRSIFDKGQTGVSGNGTGRQNLRARRAVGHQQILFDLILDTAHAGLLHSHLGQSPGIGTCRTPDDLYRPFPQGNGVAFLIGRIRCRHGVFQPVKNTVVTLVPGWTQ